MIFPVKIPKYLEEYDIHKTKFTVLVASLTYTMLLALVYVCVVGRGGPKLSRFTVHAVDTV